MAYPSGYAFFSVLEKSLIYSQNPVQFFQPKPRKKGI